VEASSGAMGGTGSREFMVESGFGEDTVALCGQCGYAANMEIASSNASKTGRSGNEKSIEEIHTPNVRTIDQLAAFVNVDHSRLAKSLVYQHNGNPLLLLMRGNDQLNESKLMAALGGGDITPIEAEKLAALTGASGGSIGPIGLEGFRIIADKRLEEANNLVSGANRNDYHLTNIDLRRDVKVEGYYDLRTIEDGEPCLQCGSKLKVSHGIELGHIFKLGTKYSEALNVTFLDENGEKKPVIMGSYGIGVERIIACHIEQSRDEHGIIWNKALAPYAVHIVAVSMNNKDIVLISNQIYKKLIDEGIEVLFDDRPNVSPGFKFKDADLLGMPFQIIVGEKGLKNHQVEIKRRKSGERTLVAVDDAVKEIKKLL
ncbi:MAG TPA: proline--tRNA ligase, partial [Bacteroidota bacterium]|nr:proline--tRNA ligase [Bacteroidota bacterium]